MPQDSGTDKYLWSVQFLDCDEGWATVAFGTVLHTTDGGGTWVAMDVSGVYNIDEYRGATILLSDIFFVDANTGWIATDTSLSAVALLGSGSPLLHTTDGGSTWQIQGSVSGSYGLVFADGDNGWAAADTMFYTHDGGNSWNPQVVQGQFHDLSLADGDHLWAITFDGQIYQYQMS